MFRFAIRDGVVVDGSSWRWNWRGGLIDYGNSGQNLGVEVKAPHRGGGRLERQLDRSQRHRVPSVAMCRKLRPVRPER